jgi:hypothetical protein
VKLNPWVNHDRLDDEVMVINLESGAYFAFDGAAADAWTLLAAGHAAGSVGEQLTGRYEVDIATVTGDVERFAAELERDGLLVADPTPTPTPAAAVTNGHQSGPALDALPVRLPYVTPTIDKYDDLQDLLLLDPIHEVDEGGWPVGRQD